MSVTWECHGSSAQHTVHTHTRTHTSHNGSHDTTDTWQGKARQGKARQGKARQAKARQGKARKGKARQGRHGMASARKAWQGAKARQGKAHVCLWLAIYCSADVSVCDVCMLAIGIALPDT